MDVPRKIPEKPKLKRSIHHISDTKEFKGDGYFDKLLEEFFANTISSEAKSKLFDGYKEIQK